MIFGIGRNAIESLYTAVCSVYELTAVFDDETKQTKQEEVLCLENQPCRISFRSDSSAVKSNDIVYEKPQEIKLFVSPDIEIKPGSKIAVTQNGRTEYYKNSGEASVYETHQEIVLEIFERWA